MPRLFTDRKPASIKNLSTPRLLNLAPGPAFNSASPHFKFEKCAFVSMRFAVVFNDRVCVVSAWESPDPFPATKVPPSTRRPIPQDLHMAGAPHVPLSELVVDEKVSSRVDARAGAA